MTDPIEPLKRKDAADRPPQTLIQEVQSEIGRLQMRYHDSDPKFWALAIAWESLRFAWYVVAGDLGTAENKLDLVEQAVMDFRRLKLRPKPEQLE